MERLWGKNSFGRRVVTDVAIGHVTSLYRQHPFVPQQVKFISLIFVKIDFQKLEREARICRKLQHPNIGESFYYLINLQTGNRCFYVSFQLDKQK